MSVIRPTAVAGSFYPADPGELARMVDAYMAEAGSHDRPAPKAVIAPHAGFIYSGPIAASAYRTLVSSADSISRVVLLGPSHRLAFDGLALSSASHYASPLGKVPLDTDSAAGLGMLDQIQVLDQAHAAEHSLEVHLPFLQRVLGNFELLPVVVGDAPAWQVAEVLDQVWGSAETLIVISSDLSHYHDYDTARRMDAATSRAIEKGHQERIDPQHACGCRPINGLLSYLGKSGPGLSTLDLRNSGDTAGPRDRVVGYGAYALQASH